MTEPLLTHNLGCSSCDSSQQKLPSGAFFSLRCLIYKVHASRRNICYSSTFIPVCQALFLKSFFDLFRRFFVQVLRFRHCYSITSAFACQVFFFEIFSSFDLKLLALAPLCQTALIDYHVFPRLSSPFFEFFFSFRSLSLDTRLSCETASLDYHASPLLVNSFFPFFCSFCIMTGMPSKKGVISMHPAF